jgi:hypothetical protein
MSVLYAVHSSNLDEIAPFLEICCQLAPLWRRFLASPYSQQPQHSAAQYVVGRDLDWFVPCGSCVNRDCCSRGETLQMLVQYVAWNARTQFQVTADVLHSCPVTLQQTAALLDCVIAAEMFSVLPE